MSELWGLWHNGWCLIKTTNYPNYIGYGVAGTREEAAEGLALFTRENRGEETFEACPFDASREPQGEFKKPSKAQLAALAYVKLMGTLNCRQAPRNWRQTTRSILRKGWVIENYSSMGARNETCPMRLTTMGIRVKESV